MKNKETILHISNLSKKYYSHKTTTEALTNVSLDIYKGEILGLVGESGSGKSTLAKTILKIEHPTTGEIYYKNIDIFQKQTKIDSMKLKKEIQMIFQDPSSSLNPKWTVFDVLSEGLKIHNICATKEELEKRVIYFLELVGLSKSSLHKKTHEFSGGQQQRICIARILAIQPEFIIADEPTSALDVSVQSQIVNLLKDLNIQSNITFLFITHNLSVAKHLCDRIAVMKDGQIVELAPTLELFSNPVHPYTKVLLSSIPIPDPVLERTKIKVLYNEQIDSYLKSPLVWTEVNENHYVYIPF